MSIRVSSGAAKVLLPLNILKHSIYWSISIHCKLLIFATDSNYICPPCVCFGSLSGSDKVGRCFKLRSSALGGLEKSRTSGAFGWFYWFDEWLELMLRPWRKFNTIRVCKSIGAAMLCFYVCIVYNTTSKRIELKNPGWSSLKANLNRFKTWATGTLRTYKHSSNTFAHPVIQVISKNVNDLNQNAIFFPRLSWEPLSWIERLR